MKTFIAVVTVLALSGCAANQQYAWGPYQQGLYNAYKDPSKVEELRVKLESHIAASEAAKQKIPPGLYAELGTMYLQAGDSSQAKKLYAKERDTWPESQGLMTAMIQNIDRREQAKAGAGK